MKEKKTIEKSLVIFQCFLIIIYSINFGGLFLEYNEVIETGMGVFCRIVAWPLYFNKAALILFIPYFLILIFFPIINSILFKKKHIILNIISISVTLLNFLLWFKMIFTPFSWV